MPKCGGLARAFQDHALLTNGAAFCQDRRLAGVLGLDELPGAWDGPGLPPSLDLAYRLAMEIGVLRLDHGLAGQGHRPLGRSVVFHAGNLRSDLPGLDPHRLRASVRGWWLRLGGGPGIIRDGPRSVRIRATLPRPAPSFFLPQRQPPQPVHRQAGPHPGGVLGTVGLGVLPPPALGGVPELALQLFGPSEQAAPEELLRRGLDFSFYFFRCGCFLFYFWDKPSPLLCFFIIL